MLRELSEQFTMEDLNELNATLQRKTRPKNYLTPFLSAHMGSFHLFGQIHRIAYSIGYFAQPCPYSEQCFQSSQSIQICFMCMRNSVHAHYSPSDAKFTRARATCAIARGLIAAMRGYASAKVKLRQAKYEQE